MVHRTYVSVQMEHWISRATEQVCWKKMYWDFQIKTNNSGSPDNPFVLPTIPPQPTANANLVSYEEDDENNIRFRGGGSANLVPAVSTCSPATRDACNGGQCVLVDGGVFACRCREGYTGAYCENSWVDFVFRSITCCLFVCTRFRYQRMRFESLVKSLKLIWFFSIKDILFKI